MIDNETKPKPCPFCGSSRWAVEEDLGIVWTECLECEARGPILERKGMKGIDAGDEAIRLWNRRHGEEELEKAWDRFIDEGGP